MWLGSRHEAHCNLSLMMHLSTTWVSLNWHPVSLCQTSPLALLSCLSPHTHTLAFPLPRSFVHPNRAAWLWRCCYVCKCCNTCTAETFGAPRLMSQSPFGAESPFNHWVILCCCSPCTLEANDQQSLQFLSHCTHQPATGLLYFCQGTCVWVSSSCIPGIWMEIVTAGPSSLYTHIKTHQGYVMFLCCWAFREFPKDPSSSTWSKQSQENCHRLASCLDLPAPDIAWRYNKKCQLQ